MERLQKLKLNHQTATSIWWLKFILSIHIAVIACQAQSHGIRNQMLISTNSETNAVFGSRCSTRWQRTKPVVPNSLIYFLKRRRRRRRRLKCSNGWFSESMGSMWNNAPMKYSPFSEYSLLPLLLNQRPAWTIEKYTVKYEQTYNYWRLSSSLI